MRGPGPGARLSEQWADGLVGNRSTPEDVRSGLLGRTRCFPYRALPPADVDALIDHPDWKVRSSAADTQRMTPEQWARLIRGEEAEHHRWALTLIAGDHGAELPEDICRGLAADPSARVRAEATRLRNLPEPVAVELTTDPDPAVRAAACTEAWAHLDASARRTLLVDAEPKVRTAALHEYHQQKPLRRQVLETEVLHRDALSTYPLERDLAEHLVRHGEPLQSSACCAIPTRHGPPPAIPRSPRRCCAGWPSG